MLFVTLITFSIFSLSFLRGVQVELEDPVCFDPDGPQNEFFSATYAEARSKFLSAASEVCPEAGRFIDSSSSESNSSPRVRKRRRKQKNRPCFQSIPIDINTDRTLDVDPFIDILYLRGTAESSKLLLVTAGTHGGEGYAGSAIQTAFLSNLRLNKDREIVFRDTNEPLDHDILFIHPVNPYGMALFRRFNEENIDINRNAIYDPAVWTQVTQETYTPNQEYKVILDAGIVYSQRPYNRQLDDETWWAIALGTIGALGEAFVQKAIIQGNYFYPESIFYGGQALSQELSKLDDFFKNDLETYLKMPLAQYEKFTLLDLHTGIGEFGQTSLFVANEPSFNAIAGILGPEVAALVPTCTGDSANSEFCQIYRDQIGALTQPPFSNEYFSDISDRIAWLVEFGTDPIIIEIKNIKNENIAYQNEYCSYNYFKTQQESKRSFYPDDSEEWKEAVLESGLGIISSILALR